MSECRELVKLDAGVAERQRDNICIDVSLPERAEDIIFVYGLSRRRAHHIHEDGWPPARSLCC